MKRTGLRKVVKTARGGVRRTYYVRAQNPLASLHAVKPTGTSAASRGAKIGAFAGAVIGGGVGTIGGAALGTAVRHSQFKDHIRAVSPWAGVGAGNDPRLHILRHRPGQVGSHYAGGAALGGAAGGAIGTVGGAAAGAAFGAAVGRIFDRRSKRR